MKFTTQHLRERGFEQHADGSFHPRGTPDPSPLAARPPRQKLERDLVQGPESPASAQAGGQGRGRFQLVVVSYRSRLIDCSNACVKWIEDAIVKTGLMPDDGPQYCPAPRFIQAKVRKSEERTEIYLYALPEPASLKP